MNKQTPVTFSFTLADAELNSYTVTNGIGGDMRFNITTWNDKRFVLIAKDVDYIEDTGTYQLSGMIAFPELDTDAAKGYAFLNDFGDVCLKLQAVSIEEAKE